MKKDQKPMGRPLKYAWLTEVIEEDVLYSPSGLVNAAQQKQHPFFAMHEKAELKDLRVTMRHTLAALIKTRGFEVDGHVTTKGQSVLKAYLGSKWIRALKPQPKK